jgi:hypothetical protein
MIDAGEAWILAQESMGEEYLPADEEPEEDEDIGELDAEEDDFDSDWDA